MPFSIVSGPPNGRRRVFDRKGPEPQLQASLSLSHHPLHFFKNTAVASGGPRSDPPALPLHHLQLGQRLPDRLGRRQDAGTHRPPHQTPIGDIPVTA